MMGNIVVCYVGENWLFETLNKWLRTFATVIVGFVQLPRTTLTPWFSCHLSDFICFPFDLLFPGM